MVWQKPPSGVGRWLFLFSGAGIAGVTALLGGAGVARVAAFLGGAGIAGVAALLGGAGITGLTGGKLDQVTLTRHLRGCLGQGVKCANPGKRRNTQNGN
jgi:hypothetical protein